MLQQLNCATNVSTLMFFILRSMTKNVPLSQTKNIVIAVPSVRFTVEYANITRETTRQSWIDLRRSTEKSLSCV